MNTRVLILTLNGSLIFMLAVAEIQLPDFRLLLPDNNVANVAKGESSHSSLSRATTSTHLAIRQSDTLTLWQSDNLGIKDV